MKKVIMSIFIVALTVGFFGGTLSADPGNPVNKPAAISTLSDPGNPVNTPAN